MKQKISLQQWNFCEWNEARDNYVFQVYLWYVEEKKGDPLLMSPRPMARPTLGL